MQEIILYRFLLCIAYKSFIHIYIPDDLDKENLEGKCHKNNWIEVIFGRFAYFIQIWIYEWMWMNLYTTQDASFPGFHTCCSNAPMKMLLCTVPTNQHNIKRSEYKFAFRKNASLFIYWHKIITLVILLTIYYQIYTIFLSTLCV